MRNTKEDAKKIKIASFLTEIDGIDEVLDIHKSYAKLFMAMYENYNPNNPDSQSIESQPIPTPPAIPVKFHHSKRKEYLYLIGLILFGWLFVHTFLCFGILKVDFNSYLTHFFAEAALGLGLLAIIAGLYKEETKQFIRMLFGR